MSTNNGRRAPAPRALAPRQVTGALAADPPAGPRKQYFTVALVSAEDLRAELQKAYDRLAGRDRSDADMARVRAVLGMPDDSDGTEVVTEVRRLKVLDRR